MKLPDAPFSTVYFKAHQTCRDTAGVEEVVEWVGLSSDPDAGTAVEPAAPLRIVPARLPGWNKYTLPAGVQVGSAALPDYFVNALIVWKDTSAYSPNANTAALIGMTPGVTALTQLAPSDVIWVRF
jgi:hypothetical protein